MFNALLASGAAVNAAVIGIIAVFALFGFVKGFASMLLKFLAGLVSLILALVLCGRCADVLNNLFSLTDALAEKLAVSLPNVFGAELTALPVSAFTEGTAEGAPLHLLGEIGGPVPAVLRQGLQQVAGDLLKVRQPAGGEGRVYGFRVCHLLT